MRVDRTNAPAEGRTEQILQQRVAETVRQRTEAAEVTTRVGLSSQMEQSPGVGVEKVNDEGRRLSSYEQSRLQVVEELFRLATGRPVKAVVPQSLTPEHGSRIQGEAIRSGEGPRRLTGRVHSPQEGKQAVRFRATGSVPMGNGRTQDVRIEFAASREILSDRAAAAEDLVEPLVQNLSSALAGLEERDFMFDMDADGASDALRFLAEEGLLQEGDADPLSEVTMKNGLELAGQDSDGDGWADGNDLIFDKLRLWTKPEPSKLQLLAMGKSGVGAVYVGHVTKPWLLPGSEDGTASQIARLGVTPKKAAGSNPAAKAGEQVDPEAPLGEPTPIPGAEGAQGAEGTPEPESPAAPPAAYQNAGEKEKPRAAKGIDVAI